MRIGIDARELCGRATGVGRYLAGLLAQWAADSRARRHEFILYAPAAPAGVPVRLTSTTQVLAGRPGLWWEQVTLARAAAADRLDVFFAPAYTAPLLLRAPIVVNIHDVSFAAHPEWFRLREGLRRRWLSRHAGERAAAVVTVSEFSRRELAERFGIPPARIHVIPAGIAPASTSPRPAPSAPRVLYVGSIFNRRHVPDLVRAIARVRRNHSDVSLDIVGDDRTYPPEDLAGTIAAEGLDGCVRRHAYVADADLPGLYARARAFAFLSEYEGFGLTPLEALASGVPAVLADAPAARETCGDAALYVPTGDLAATAAALERVLFDESTRARLLAAAPGIVAKYDWHRSAADTLALLEQAAAAR